MPTADLRELPTAPSGWPVWGHDAAAATLRREVAQGRVRHAYLIAGPDGVGKTTLARAFARVLCCRERPAPDLACGRCLACRKIDRGVHPDVQTFGLATQAALTEKSGGKNTSITVETVRQLCATTALRPMESEWRCILLDDAELLQEVAQEALLKTLEEPPPFVVLMLLTNDAELLLPTIRSRCQAVDLRPTARTTIADALGAAGFGAARADELAALAGGCLGWALRAASDGSLLHQRREAVDRALAWIGGTAYDRLVDAVRLGDSFTKRRPEVFADLDTLLGLWRDAMLLRVAQPHYLTYRGDAERLRELTRKWDLSDLHRAIEAVQSCVVDLEANVRPRLALETMVLQWPTSAGRP